MRLVPEEISFSGKSRLSSFGPHVLTILLDYLGLNAALFEWAESYDSKVRYISLSTSLPHQPRTR